MGAHTKRGRGSQVPFRFGWYSWDLGEYRPYPDGYWTYWPFPYETLPPLPEVSPNFAWLTSGGNAPERKVAGEASTAKLHSRLDYLASATLRLGLSLPDTFVQFMRAPELHARFRSGTGYWFFLSNRLVQCPGFDDGYLIGFLRDQQDCIIWCLCLTPDGEHCVLALPWEAVLTLPESSFDALFGSLEYAKDIEVQTSSVVDVAANADLDVPTDMTSIAADINDICICAHSFDEFIYRFWLEDEIAWKLEGLDQTPLTDVERHYLEHYLRQLQLNT